MHDWGCCALTGRRVCAVANALNVIFDTRVHAAMNARAGARRSIDAYFDARSRAA
jgi:hypothetical protein